jgi:hypothetical protein
MSSASSTPTSPIAASSPATIGNVDETEEQRPLSGEDEDDSEDDSEEDEPQLKYERAAGDIGKVVRGDLLSAFCVGSKVIV